MPCNIQQTHGFLFLLLLASVKGSLINFDLAFSEECMDERCPVIYHSDKPIRPIGTPYDEQSIYAIQSTLNLLKFPSTQPSATGITAMPSTKASSQTPKPKTFENTSAPNDQTGLPVPSVVPSVSLGAPKPKTLDNKRYQNDQTGLPVPSAMPTPKPSVSIDLTQTPTIRPVIRPSQFIDPQYIALEKAHYKFRFVRGKNLKSFSLISPITIMSDFRKIRK